MALVDTRIQSLTITADLKLLDEMLVTEIIEMVQSTEGETPLHFHIHDPETKATATLTSDTSRINITRELMHFLDNNDALNYKVN